MICSTCQHDLHDCTCPDIDARLHDLAYAPGVPIVFKWCRTCDKHYARCRCATPDFYVLSGGEALDLTGVRTLDGQPPDIDLSPGSERRH